MLGPKREQPQSWQEILKIISSCPVCGSSYNIQNTRLFAQTLGANMVHFFCEKCESNFIAVIMTQSKGLSTIGLVSDLDFEDVKQKFFLPPITIDEIISYHQQINNNNFLNS